MVFLSDLCVMLKKYCSEVSIDSDITYMPALVFFAILGVFLGRLPELEQKASFWDRHYLSLLFPREAVYLA